MFRIGVLYIQIQRYGFGLIERSKGSGLSNRWLGELKSSKTNPNRKGEKDMKYEMEWTKKDGERVKGQIYTAEQVSHQLENLEEWGATNITLKSIEEQ
jgi:hypothetical protein